MADFVANDSQRMVLWVKRDWKVTCEADLDGYIRLHLCDCRYRWIPMGRYLYLGSKSDFGLLELFTKGH
jgi:hypothetical protein